MIPVCSVCVAAAGHQGEAARGGTDRDAEEVPAGAHPELHDPTGQYGRHSDRRAFLRF